MGQLPPPASPRPPPCSGFAWGAGQLFGVPLRLSWGQRPLPRCQGGRRHAVEQRQDACLSKWAKGRSRRASWPHLGSKDSLLSQDRRNRSLSGSRKKPPRATAVSGGSGRRTWARGHRAELMARKTGSGPGVIL